jgi:hypothetical protein
VTSRVVDLSCRGSGGVEELAAEEASAVEEAAAA